LILFPIKATTADYFLTLRQEHHAVLDDFIHNTLSVRRDQFGKITGRTAPPPNATHSVQSGVALVHDSADFDIPLAAWQMAGRQNTTEARTSDHLLRGERVIESMIPSLLKLLGL
jgi:hypothetical protein